MNLSKSKYCKGVQCSKILWMDRYKSEEQVEVENSSVLDNGNEVGEVAKDLFGFHIDIKFNDDLNVMIDDTKSLLNMENIVITEASFVYENNFCSVDILKKVGDSFYVYEVKSSTSVKDIFIHDISYQVYILKKLGYNVVSANVVYINNRYVKKGSLELDRLFNIFDVTDRLYSMSDVESKINEINSFGDLEPTIDIGIHCTKPYDCPYFKYCSRHLPSPNVFDVRVLRNSKKFDLYKSGIYGYEDLLLTDINDKYKMQIDFELNNHEDYINRGKIKDFLDTLKYPLYFLDFETFQQSIPMYDGIRPYEQIPFQYSIHYIESEDSELKHLEFLALPDVDPRRDLALRLISDIPTDVCVLAYNMKFERMVIKNLSELYPDLSVHLMSIHDNMKDLMVPFYNRDYYTRDMHGSCSIKYVLPALFPLEPSLDYHNLDEVHNGKEAMNSYASMGKLDKDSFEKLRVNMLKYCCLDTFAMVKIWEKLMDVVK